MKSCHKWMIICLLGAVAIVFLLPRFGLPIVGASILIPLLIFACCVVPMVMIMFSSRSGKTGGCCGHKDESKTPNPQGVAAKTVADKPSCH